MNPRTLLLVAVVGLVGFYLWKMHGQAPAQPAPRDLNPGGGGQSVSPGAIVDTLVGWVRQLQGGTGSSQLQTTTTAV